MLKQWCSIRKRSLFIPTPEEADVTNKVCDVILSNPDHFPPHTFEAGIANSVLSLLRHCEGWTKDQAIAMDGILQKYGLGNLDYQNATGGYEVVLDLFAGINPIGQTGA